MMDGPFADKNLYWTAIVYFVGLFLLGVAWWKALAISAIAGTCWYLSYNRQIVTVLGMAVLILGLLNWIVPLPDPAHWGELLAAVKHSIY